MSDLADNLREHGYDIVPPRPGSPADREIIARRDDGGRAVLITADASGRFRVEMTWRVGEWPSRAEIAGAPVRVVDGVTRTVSITGSVASPAGLLAVVDSLDAFAPWADGGLEDHSRSPS